MATLLLEIGTEELPAQFVFDVREDIKRLARQLLGEARIAHGQLRAYATPRRIALFVEDLAKTSEGQLEKRRGPPVHLGLDASGQATKAAEAFANDFQISPKSLVIQRDEKGEYLYALLYTEAQSSKDLLPDIVRKLLLQLPASKKMRWGAKDGPQELSFVRPIAWLLCLLDDSPVDLKLFGIQSGGSSYGHRFLAPQAIEISSADSYLEQLEQAHVIANFTKRQTLTWQAIKEKATSQGFVPMYNAQLLKKISCLVEHPFAVFGSFSSAFLQLAPEVLETLLMHHQHFVPLRDRHSKLVGHFVAVSNIPSDDTTIHQGYQQALIGGLYDALFFWHADRKKSLSQHAWALSGMNFRGGLGSIADKVDRVTRMVHKLLGHLDFSAEDIGVLEAALPIFKADLATQMVAELPQLEGIIARAYAKEEGLPDAVAITLEHGARPLYVGGPLAESRTGAVVAIADILDSLLSFYYSGSKPSGSTDRFGLRRLVNALIRSLNRHGWTMPLSDLIEMGCSILNSSVALREEDITNCKEQLSQALWERAMFLLGEEGIPAQYAKANISPQASIIEVSRKSHLLYHLSRREEFRDLLELYKRSANLAIDSDSGVKIKPRLFQSPYEAPLYQALGVSQAATEQLITHLSHSLIPWDLGSKSAQGFVQSEEIESAIHNILALKTPLDAFLDNVLVKVAQDRLKHNRLALLREVKNSLSPLGRLELLEGLASSQQTS